MKTHNVIIQPQWLDYYHWICKYFDLIVITGYKSLAFVQWWHESVFSFVTTALQTNSRGDHYIYIYLVCATHAPPKTTQFDWFTISVYWAISRDWDLKLRILFSSQNVVSAHWWKPINRKYKQINPGKTCYRVYFWSVDV